MNFGSNSTWQFATAEGDRNLADLAGLWRGDGRSWLGGASETESHCCLGFHPALTAPVHQISFTQQIPFRWETGERQQTAKSDLTKPVARAFTVLMLIIDQAIKADEEIFSKFCSLVLKVWHVIVHLQVLWRDSPKDQYFQSSQRALLSVTLSKAITIES